MGLWSNIFGRKKESPADKLERVLGEIEEVIKKARTKPPPTPEELLAFAKRKSELVKTAVELHEELTPEEKTSLQRKRLVRYQHDIEDILGVEL